MKSDLDRRAAAKELNELKNKDENLIFLGKIKLIVVTDFMGCFMHGNVLEHAWLNQDCWGSG